MTYIHQSGRVCAECGIYVRPGDGGIQAWGRLFCSDLCADCQDPSFSDSCQMCGAADGDPCDCFDPQEAESL